MNSAGSVNINQERCSMKNLHDCDCDAADTQYLDEEVNIKDDNCIVVVSAMPIASDVRLLIIQTKKNGILSETALKNTTVLQHTSDEGYEIYVLLERRDQRISFSSLFAESTATERHGASGTGGVWSPRKFKCVRRTCSVGCGTRSCGEAVDECSSRFDWNCSHLIGCIICN